MGMTRNLVYGSYDMCLDLVQITLCTDRVQRANQLTCLPSLRVRVKPIMCPSCQILVGFPAHINGIKIHTYSLK